MGRKAIDLTGKKFGRLLVIQRSYIHSGSGHLAMWDCVCDCGKLHTTDSDSLRSGGSQSCGCRQKEMASKMAKINSTKHGMWGTRFYRIWYNVKKRGTGRELKGIYPDIDICDRWLEFDNFRDDMYESYLKHVEEFGEKDTSIDRINGKLGYYKDNCRWATVDEQSNNVLRNVFIDYDNKTQSISAWAREYNMSPSTLHSRVIKMKWSMSDSLLKPINYKSHD